MNDAALATDVSVEAAVPGGLSRGLRSRHVTMISIGGIIGAGLFVGSSAAIATIAAAGSSAGAKVISRSTSTIVVRPELVFAFLVNASGAIMLIVYLLIALAQIRLRRRLERTDPGRLTLRMWWFPWASWGVSLSILAVLVAMAFTPDLASQLYASLVCLGVVVVGYLALRRRYGIPRGS